MNTKAIKLVNIGQLASFQAETAQVEYQHRVEVLIEDGLFQEIGPHCSGAEEVIDCRGRLVTPGFVDPHTHPVFLTGREAEFELRTRGSSYEEIARRGGGIRSSLQGVRQAGEEELVRVLTRRMDRFLRLGTTTVEAKSGYGLDTASELKSLGVIQRVNRSHPVDIIATFLGAHALPPEYDRDPEGYVDLVCQQMIPAVVQQGVALFCDVFCEPGYFSVPQARRILEAAKAAGLTPRLHADEFHDSGGAKLAAAVQAISADHLVAVKEAGIRALAREGITAILLPATTFFLGGSAYAPARDMIAEGVRVALATDFNPGSSPVQSMPLVISLACLYLGLSVEEALAGATYHAAHSLGIQREVGSVEIGKKADLVIWDLEQLIEIPYYVSDHPIQQVIKDGNQVVLNN